MSPDDPRFSRVPGRVEVVDDVPGSFAQVVMERFATRSGSPFSRFCVALSGGSLARHCYERLADEAAAAIDWDLVDVLLGDERCVAPDDPDANQRLVREALLAQVAPPGSFTPMSCEDGPQAYQQVLERLSPVDLAHLGLGDDGHTASLFPGSGALHAPRGELVARNVDPSGHNPHDRLTFTFEALAGARFRVVTASGAAKSRAFARVAAGEDLPAGHLPPESTLWLVDPPVVADL